MLHVEAMDICKHDEAQPDPVGPGVPLLLAENISAIKID